MSSKILNDMFPDGIPEPEREKKTDDSLAAREKQFVIAYLKERMPLFYEAYAYVDHERLRMFVERNTERPVTTWNGQEGFE